jgi:GNAT superfamily N-acetyltransferase
VTLWYRFLGETVYRRVFVFERALASPTHNLDTGIPVTVASLTESEIGDYCAFRPEEDPADAAIRMAQGHRYFAARHDGSIVSGGWVGIGRANLPYLNGEILLQNCDIYAYSFYTSPEFRNFNLSMALTKAYVEHFQACGYSRSIAVVMPENPAGMRAVEKRGLRRAGEIGYIKFGPWRHDFCRTAADSLPVGWRPLAKC